MGNNAVRRKPCDANEGPKDASHQSGSNGTEQNQGRRESVNMSNNAGNPYDQNDRSKSGSQHTHHSSRGRKSGSNSTKPDHRQRESVKQRKSRKRHPDTAVSRELVLYCEHAARKKRRRGARSGAHPRRSPSSDCSSHVSQSHCSERNKTTSDYGYNANSGSHVEQPDFSCAAQSGVHQPMPGKGQCDKHTPYDRTGHGRSQEVGYERNKDHPAECRCNGHGPVSPHGAQPNCSCTTYDAVHQAMLEKGQCDMYTRYESYEGRGNNTRPRDVALDENGNSLGYGLGMERGSQRTGHCGCSSTNNVRCIQTTAPAQEASSSVLNATRAVRSKARLVQNIVPSEELISSPYKRTNVCERDGMKWHRQDNLAETTVERDDDVVRNDKHKPCLRCKHKSDYSAVSPVEGSSLTEKAKASSCYGCCMGHRRVVDSESERPSVNPKMCPHLDDQYYYVSDLSQGNVYGNTQNDSCDSDNGSGNVESNHPERMKAQGNTPNRLADLSVAERHESSSHSKIQRHKRLCHTQTLRNTNKSAEKENFEKSGATLEAPNQHSNNNGQNRNLETPNQRVKNKVENREATATLEAPNQRTNHNNVKNRSLESRKKRPF